jgi:hypothetical protein
MVTDELQKNWWTGAQLACEKPEELLGKSALK